MTSIQFSTIAQSIAEIDLSSHRINVKDADNIPINGITECPYFAPNPSNFISDILFTRASFGSGGDEKMNLEYTMNYQYFHAPIGQVLTFQSYADLLDNIAYILEQIADNDAPEGAIDVRIMNIPHVGGITDSKGQEYHGADISLRVTEFING